MGKTTVLFVDSPTLSSASTQVALNRRFRISTMPLMGKHKTAKAVMGVTLIFLAVELLDELIYGVLVGAWPLIAEDLHLSYIQIGLAMTLPNVIASTIEPIIGIWGDIGPRRALILGGGVGFAIATFSALSEPRLRYVAGWTGTPSTVFR